MGLLDLASHKSVWRGLDYYESQKVKQIKKINDSVYTAVVQGSQEYNVEIDLEHPKKSFCDCPYAEGKRIVCKHKVALFFEVFPQKAQEMIDEREEYYQERERYEQEKVKRYLEVRKEVEDYVDSLSAEEIKNMLINYLVNEQSYLYEDEEYEEDEYDCY